MCNSKAAKKARMKKEHKETTPVEGEHSPEEQANPTPPPPPTPVHEEGITPTNIQFPLPIHQQIYFFFMI